MAKVEGVMYNMLFRKTAQLMSNQSLYWQYPTILEHEFNKLAQTGDILLFRTNNHIGTWFQRKVTKSHFDHCGIIYRYGPHIQDIFVLEADAGDGVRHQPWMVFRDCMHTFYEMIALRKVDVVID